MHDRGVTSPPMNHVTGIRMIRRSIAMLIVWLFSMAPVGLLAQSVGGKTDIDPKYDHPGNRYTYENKNFDIPAHWGGKISAQFIGISEIDVQKEALKDFLQLSDAGGYETYIQGFPGDIFTQSKVSGETNFLLLEVDKEDMVKMSSGGSTLDLPDMFSQSPNEFAAEIAKRGIVSLSKGCGARWSATSENVINAFVITIASDLTKDEKISCLKETMPRAFGVFSLATNYSIPLVSADGTEHYKISFPDNSEILLELEALRACRATIPNSARSCPLHVINEVLRYHGTLSGKFGD